MVFGWSQDSERKLLLFISGPPIFLRQQNDIQSKLLMWIHWATWHLSPIHLMQVYISASHVHTVHDFSIWSSSCYVAQVNSLSYSHNARRQCLWFYCWHHSNSDCWSSYQDSFGADLDCPHHLYSLESSIYSSADHFRLALTSRLPPPLQVAWSPHQRGSLPLLILTRSPSLLESYTKIKGPICSDAVNLCGSGVQTCLHVTVQPQVFADRSSFYQRPYPRLITGFLPTHHLLKLKSDCPCKEMPKIQKLNWAEVEPWTSIILSRLLLFTHFLIDPTQLWN